MAQHGAEGEEVEDIVFSKSYCFGSLLITGYSSDSAFRERGNKQRVLFPAKIILTLYAAKPTGEVPVHRQVDSGLHHCCFLRGEEGFAFHPGTVVLCCGRCTVGCRRLFFSYGNGCQPCGEERIEVLEDEEWLCD